MVLIKLLTVLVCTLQCVLAKQIVTLGNNFQFEFEQQYCSIKILAKDSGIEIFESKNNLLATGYGNVDIVKIMEDGNVINFPRSFNYTSNMIWENFEIENEVVSIQGRLILPHRGELPFEVVFKALDENRVQFDASLPGAYSETYRTNYLSMQYVSSVDEEIYGMGLQYTVWNFKGQKIPLIVDEGGVGRGDKLITQWENKYNKGAGGSSVSSYGTTPNYITNLNRGMIFNTTYIGIADFSQDETTSFLFWHAKSLTGVITYGQHPLQLAQLSAQTIGLMPRLPSWILHGAVLGIVGGQDFVEEKYALLKHANIKLAGVWMQDWVGQHKFPEGTRLLWNWALNRNWYPQWDRMVADWEKDGVRPLVYFNPYIADLSDVYELEQNLFQEGIDGGYFVKNIDGDVYLIQSLSIQFAIVDFTNPAACQWFGKKLVANAIAEAHAGGWMHDFGEYIPFDAVLYDGSDLVEYHNKYPEAWAKLAADFLADYPDIVYFMRSASTTSPRYTRLFWMGDQLSTYDENDGMWSAMIGLLNWGLSGFTMGHSDIGGYTSTEIPDIDISYIRDKHLLHRWIEMSTFSDIVMRSHPGNLPRKNFQIWDEPETLQFFKNFTDIHVALADYKELLVEEASTLGTPITRPLLLHFPNDKEARAEHSQFILGPNILMAPIFDPVSDSRIVYLPGPANWTHIWTRQEYQVSAQGDTRRHSGPLGRPLVFVR